MSLYKTIAGCLAIVVVMSIYSDYAESVFTKTSTEGNIEEPYVPDGNRAVNEHNGRVTVREKERQKKIDEELKKHKIDDGVPTVDSEARILDMNDKYYRLLRRCVRDGELGNITKRMGEFLDEIHLTIEDVKYECDRLRNEKGNGRSKRSYIKWIAGVWEKCIIPYVKDSGLDEASAAALDVTFAYYEKYTGFRFVPFNNSNEDLGLTHDNYLNFTTASGCWSYVGNLRSNGQSICPCTGMSTQVHEIGHALGFMHEQKNPLSMDYVSLYFESINRSYWSQYYRDFIIYMDGNDHFYDISSTMHYADWESSINYGRTMIANDPDLDFMVGWGNDYYLFRDIQPYHGCFQEFPNCDPLPVCENDGYPTVYEGSCKCRCPDGLDPATRCTSVLEPVAPTTWPEGAFTVLKTTLGDCPDGFAEGQMGYTNPEFTWTGSVNISPGYSNGYTWLQDVCTQTASSNSGYHWPAGQYCILRYGGTCPTGFIAGLMEYSGDEAPANSNTGTLPDGTKGTIHQYIFCCRNDGPYSAEISLPTDKPFILFRTNYYGCQAVEGMLSIPEYYFMKGETVSYGSLPVTYALRKGMVNTYYCAYTPKASKPECNQVVELTGGFHTIQSPNYPSNYDAGVSCIWVLKSPEGTTMKLDFIDFEVSSSEGSCDGYVGIRNYYPGMPPKQMPERSKGKLVYTPLPGIPKRMWWSVKVVELPIVFCNCDNAWICGHNNLRTYWTYFNTLTVTFKGGLSSYKGFMANISVLDDRCYGGDGEGNYAGDVAETRYFNPCVPWIDAIDCLFNQFDPRTIDFDLNNNYCRNVGTGQMPWCYTRVEGCIRENCDACQEGRCFDMDDACDDYIFEDFEFCDKNELGEAGRLCKQSCGMCRQTQTGPVQCEAPKDIGCVSPTPQQQEYNVGDTVRYDCPTGVEHRNSTCTSEGTWSYVNPICNVCPNGWSVVDKRCFLWLGYEKVLTHSEATNECSALGAGLAMPNTSAINTFIREAADIYLEDAAKVWLGVEEKEGRYIWRNGEEITWNNWAHDSVWTCAYTSSGYWWPTSCLNANQVVCEMDISVSPVCEDNSPSCAAMLEKIPDLCTSQPDYAWHNCRATCAVDDCETPIECTTEDGDFLSVVSDRTVFQGEFIEYECEDDNYLTSGNLKRACLPSGELNGEMPVCTPVKQTKRVEFYNDKELFQRGYGSSGVVLSPDVESARIPIDGYVSEWIFYSSRIYEEVSFQVWRATENTDEYRLIGENIVSTTIDNGKMIARIPLEEQINAQEGDLIGIHPGTSEALYYDRCDAKYMPENSDWYTFSADIGNLVVGDTYTFSNVNCRIYSLRVTMNPCGCE